MDILPAFGVAVGIVVAFLLRRRFRLAGIGVRTLVGFGCGALLGLVWGAALAGAAGPIAAATGVPWPVLRVVLVVFGGCVAAGPVRKALEEAFPPSRENGERNRNAPRQP